MSTGCQKDRKTCGQTGGQTDRRTDRQTFQLSYQNKSILECQQDVKASVRQEGRYTERRADSVTERQNDSMAESRAAKEPALVFFTPLIWTLCFASSSLVLVVVHVQAKDCHL